jgi:hypothetical protein
MRSALLASFVLLLTTPVFAGQTPPPATLEMDGAFLAYAKEQQYPAILKAVRAEAGIPNYWCFARPGAKRWMLYGAAENVLGEPLIQTLYLDWNRSLEDKHLRVDPGKEVPPPVQVIAFC